MKARKGLELDRERRGGTIERSRKLLGAGIDDRRMSRRNSDGLLGFRITEGGNTSHFIDLRYLDGLKEISQK